MIRESTCPRVFESECRRVLESESCGDCLPVFAYVITTCNANGIRDDSFDVEMDNVYIGAVNISTNVTAANVFVGISRAAASLHTGIYIGCTYVQQRFDTAAMDSLTAGSHSLKLTCTALNGSGNLFTLNVMSVTLDAGVLRVRNKTTLTSIAGTYIVGDIITRAVTIDVCG